MGVTQGTPPPLPWGWQPGVGICVCGWWLRQPHLEVDVECAVVNQSRDSQQAALSVLFRFVMLVRAVWTPHVARFQPFAIIESFVWIIFRSNHALLLLVIHTVVSLVSCQ